jgi:protein-disulfide isomerase
MRVLSKVSGMSRLISPGILQLVLLCVWATNSHAKPSDDLAEIKKELSEIKNAQAATQKELTELKALLIKSKEPSAPPVDLQDLEMAVNGSPFLGRKDSALVLIEFFDYDCPFCARHVQQTFPQIEREYISTGKVRYVVRDYPIDAIHPTSMKKHEAAHCAGDQGKYWEMRARLFEKKLSSAPDDVIDDARRLGLNQAEFQRCIESEKHATAIRADFADGNQAGVSGSPTFFLGTAESGGSRVKVLKVIRGAQPYQAFKDSFDAALIAAAGKKS